MTHTIRRAYCALTAAAILVACAADAPAKWTNWTASWENDTFVPSGLNSDEFYTNGVRFAIVRDPAWGWAQSVGDWWMNLPFFGDEVDFTPTSSFVLGQNMFTPTVITEFTVNPDDRPYAGFLYGGVRVDVNYGDGSIHHGFEFDVGVMGPPALARETQKAVHVLRQSRIPKGWEHQLGTEIGVQLSYLSRARFGTSFFDVIPHGGVALGTIQTYANLGATARVGVNLSGFPSLLIPWTAVPVPERPKFEAALFAGGEGRVYARNAYLDGSLIGGSPHVDKEWTVYDWRFGATVRWQAWRLTYTVVRRSREFENPPPPSHGFHNYGAIAISRELGGGS